MRGREVVAKVPNRRGRIAGGMQVAIVRQHRDRQLDGDRIDVVPGHGVRSEIAAIVGVLRIAQNRRDARGKGAGPEVQGVECRARIVVIRVIHRAREHVNAIAKKVDALRGEAGVVGHGARPDIGGHGEQRVSAAAEHRAPGGAALLQDRDGVGLAQAQPFRARPIQGRDRSRHDRRTRRHRRR